MYLITGATGLLGSHVAEQLATAGERVRALVRKGSDTRFLRELGVELVSGDVTNASSMTSAFQDVDIVVHAAARLGEWGSWHDFEQVTVEGTRHVVNACLAYGCRLIHISSISVYGQPAPQPNGIAETTPLATRFWWWDHYRRAKVKAEEIVGEAHKARGLAVTVLRPGWIYGPRDRSRIFRMTNALRRGHFPIIGRGDNCLNISYVGNVAGACLLAAECDAAISQSYNVCHDGPITQRAFLELLARELQVRPPRWSIPYSLAFHGSFLMETIGRTLHIPKPPPLTRYTTWYLGKHIPHSTEMIERELGWKPDVGYEEGIRRTLAWLRQCP